MAKLFAMRIKEGSMTIQEVPELWRQEVIELLESEDARENTL